MYPRAPVTGVGLKTGDRRGQTPTYLPTGAFPLQELFPQNFFQEPETSVMSHPIVVPLRQVPEPLVSTPNKVIFIQTNYWIRLLALNLLICWPQALVPTWKSGRTVMRQRRKDGTDVIWSTKMTFNTLINTFLVESQYFCPEMISCSPLVSFARGWTDTALLTSPHSSKTRNHSHDPTWTLVLRQQCPS